MASPLRALMPAMTPTAPATPPAQTVAPTSQPGNWKHPKFDEITRRQYARTFSEQNAKAVLLFASYLMGTFLVPSLTAGWWILSPLFRLAQSYSPWDFYLLWTVRLLFVYNIGIQFRPLLKGKDDITDIPLTPSQRAAMGLDPSILTPQTPEGSYITPPRYSRSTPRSSMSNNSARRLSQSPLSGSPINGSPRAGSNSPFSPNASPLLQKAFGGGAAARRLNFDRQSPLATGYFGDSTASNTPGTPTPAPAPAPSKSSVGLNNKWLYEKGRGSPGRSLFT